MLLATPITQYTSEQNNLNRSFNKFGILTIIFIIFLIYDFPEF